MTIDDKIREKKLQYDINKEASKISSLWSGKVDKYEYLTGEKILPSNQRRVIEKAKFTYSPLRTETNQTGTPTRSDLFFLDSCQENEGNEKFYLRLFKMNISVNYYNNSRNKYSQHF